MNRQTCSSCTSNASEWGFVRVAAAVPHVRLADCAANTQTIISMLRQADAEQVEVVCFPELSTTGYSCGDLFFQQQLLNDSDRAIKSILKATADFETILLVGAPLWLGSRLYNCAYIMHRGKLIGVVPKTHIPNNNEFSEKRWFTSGRIADRTEITWDGCLVPFGMDLVFSTRNFHFGIEICEDLWTPIPPGTQLALQGAEVIFNLSASNELVDKAQYRRNIVGQLSSRTCSGYVYVSSGWGESTTDVVFSGDAMIVDNGTLLSETERFAMHDQLIIDEIHIDRLRAERLKNGNFDNDRTGQYRMVNIDNQPKAWERLHRTINPYPFIPPLHKRATVCNDIFSIQATGLARRWMQAHSQALVVGISGGLDSTLALLVCVKMCDKLGIDRKKVIGITMPGFGTTDRTYHNALQLMDALGVTRREISIKEASLQHFNDIGHNVDVHDTTYENTQARERTQILMDVANQVNGLVVGTGDLSELALGWATYNGDQMSMYAVNAGIPKTLVRYMVEFAAHDFAKVAEPILIDVLATPVSPELLPTDDQGSISQKTEDLIGPYELHDFFLYYMLRCGFPKRNIAFMACCAFEGKYTPEVIDKWLNVFTHRFFTQQFKRSAMPDGPKVGSVGLSPRGDWHMPSDAYAW